MVHSVGRICGAVNGKGELMRGVVSSVRPKGAAQLMCKTSTVCLSTTLTLELFVSPQGSLSLMSQASKAHHHSQKDSGKSKNG